MAAGATSTASGALPPAIVPPNVAGSVQIGNNNIQINNPLGSIVIDRREAVRRRLEAGPPPKPPDPFIGRAPERQRLLKLITDARSTGQGVGAAVSGGDGAGRSSLLKRVASDAGRSGGVLVASGLGSDGAVLIADDIAQTLYNAAWYTDPLEKVTVETARAQLQDLDAVALVYDAALRDDDVTRLGDILAGGATLIATRDVSFGSELLAIPVGPMPRDEAIELLASRAGISPLSDMASLARICELLGDWPGALAIAGKAMNVRSLAPADALAGIEAISPAVPFERTAEYERAYALAVPALDANARLTLASAANVPGPTTDPAMLRRILGDPAWFDDATARLQLLGLLRLNSPRFRIAPGLREAIPSSRPLAESVRDAYVEAVLADLRARPNDPALIEAELGGLVESVQSGDSFRLDRAATVARAIDPYLILHGLWGLAASSLSAIARYGTELDPADHAWTQHELGTLALVSGRRDEARSLLTRALEIRTSIGDEAGAAYTRHNLDRLDPPPIDGHRDGRDGSNGGGGIPRAVVAGAIAGIAVLLVAGTVVLGGFFGGSPVDSPSVEPATPALSEAVETPSPPIVTPSPASPSPSVTVPPLGDFRIDYRPPPIYAINWGEWAARFTIRARSGGATYTFALDGQQPTTTNPAEFLIPGVGCDGVRVTGSVTSPGFHPEDVDVTLRPDECGKPPGQPIPDKPDVGSCEGNITTLKWADGGGAASRRFEVVLSERQGDEFVPLEPTLIDGYSYEASLRCTDYRWTVEAIDYLGQRSGPANGDEFGVGPG